MAHEKSLLIAPTSPKIVRTISSRHAAGSFRSYSVSSSISLELARRAGVFMGPLFFRPKRSLALGIWLIWLLYSVARVDGVATGDGLLGACDGVTRDFAAVQSNIFWHCTGSGSF